MAWFTLMLVAPSHLPYLVFANVSEVSWVSVQ